MIRDRYGTIDRGTFTYYPGILRSAEFYGFDPDDPIYRTRAPYEKGREWCGVCQNHPAIDRRFPCDVMMARAADMEAAGYPATYCRGCGYTMPVRADQSEYRPTCWHCERQQEARARSRRRVTASGAIYVDDGNGCVVAEPAWMVDWDGNPGAGS